MVIVVRWFGNGVYSPHADLTFWIKLRQSYRGRRKIEGGGKRGSRKWGREAKSQVMNIQSLHSGTKYCVCVSVPASVCVLFYRAWVKLWNMTKCSFLTLIKLTKNSSSLRDVAELHNHSNWQLRSKRATCTGGHWTAQLEGSLPC